MKGFQSLADSAVMKVGEVYTTRMPGGEAAQAEVRTAMLPRGPLPPPSGPNKRWSMDFITDTLADGR
jgi:hypothetical protein